LLRNVQASLQIARDVPMSLERRWTSTHLFIPHLRLGTQDVEIN
jgi:hypothetical protein